MVFWLIKYSVIFVRQIKAYMWKKVTRTCTIKGGMDLFDGSWHGSVECVIVEPWIIKCAKPGTKKVTDGANSFLFNSNAQNTKLI